MTVIPSTPGLPLLAFTRRNAAFRFSQLTYFLHQSIRASWVFGPIHRPGRFSHFPSRLSGFTRQSRREVQLIWIFCCLSSLRFMAYCPPLLVRAFDHSSRFGLSVAPPLGIRSASLALPTS